MRIARTLAELQAELARFRHVAFVPTMGNLHDGHIALVRHARTRAEGTVASIFVNRLQFLPHEDFDRYPRSFDADCGRLREAGCDLLFAPDEGTLYPEPQTFSVHPDPALADILEGEFRPGFFTGVCTVVMKLFACVRPAVAVFGRKDYQQWQVVRRMVEQFALPIRIEAVPTLRAEDGLALSSRNGYLDRAQRAQATQLHAALREMALAVRAGGADVAGLGPRTARTAFASRIGQIQQTAMHRLAALGWQPDYMVLRRQSDLGLPGEGDRLVALGAARLGGVRLIDNLELPAGTPPDLS